MSYLSVVQASSCSNNTDQAHDATVASTLKTKKRCKCETNANIGNVVLTAYAASSLLHYFKFGHNQNTPPHVTLEIRATQHLNDANLMQECPHKKTRSYKPNEDLSRTRSMLDDAVQPITSLGVTPKFPKRLNSHNFISPGLNIHSVLPLNS